MISIVLYTKDRLLFGAICGSAHKLTRSACLLCSHITDRSLQLASRNARGAAPKQTQTWWLELAGWTMRMGPSLHCWWQSKSRLIWYNALSPPAVLSYKKHTDTLTKSRNNAHESMNRSRGSISSPQMENPRVQQLRVDAAAARPLHSAPRGPESIQYSIGSQMATLSFVSSTVCFCMVALDDAMPCHPILFHSIIDTVIANKYRYVLYGRGARTAALVSTIFDIWSAVS